MSARRFTIQASVTRFERTLRGVVEHKAFITSYLGGCILFLLVAGVFGLSRSRSDLLSGTLLLFMAVYFVVIGVHWSARAIGEYLSSKILAGVWMTLWASLVLFLSVLVVSAACRILLHWLD
jgi:hypothetical protein